MMEVGQYLITFMDKFIKYKDEKPKHGDFILCKNIK
jgi:hypothetical protein